VKVPYNDILNRTGETYAIKDQKFWQLLDDVRVQCGGTWKSVAVDARLSTRSLRKLRNKGAATVSYTWVDKLLSRLGFPHRLQELEWYTPEQLVEMGIWKPHNIDGLTHKRKAVRRDNRSKASV
jgi:hypothetical protein